MTWRWHSPFAGIVPLFFSFGFFEAKESCPWPRPNSDFPIHWRAFPHLKKKSPCTSRSVTAFPTGFVADEKPQNSCLRAEVYRTEVVGPFRVQ